MDGLSGAASIIAVISLAVQLRNSIHDLSRLLKSIKDAPKELQLLMNDLDRLRQILAEVALIADMQKGLEFAPAPSVTLFATMKECQSRFQSLEAYVSKVIVRFKVKGIRKALIPLKIPSQKETLQKLEAEIRRSIDDLSVLLVLNSTKIQLASLGQAPKLLVPTPSSEVSTILHSSILPRKENHGSFKSKQNVSTTSSYAWYKTSGTISYSTVLGLFGYCVMYSQSCFSKRGEPGYKKIDSMKRYDWSVGISLWFIRRYLEFQSQVYCGQVERRWRVYPIDPQRESPVWELCRYGDTQGVLKLFSQGLSPYLKDGMGRSLLNTASAGCHTELCRVLLQHGISLCNWDRGTSYAVSPMYDIDPHRSGVESAWDTIQMLVHHDEDKSEDASIAMIDGMILYLGNEVFLTLGQRIFSITYEEDTSLLDALFTLEYLPLYNIRRLEAASEYVGQDMCSILESGGINVQNFIDRMMNINGGNNVYLKPVDYGARGIGGRRLMRGKHTPLSLRWEWDPLPKENPYQVLEEFSHLDIQDASWCPRPYKEWPFGALQRNQDQHYLRRAERKFRKTQRKDKVNQLQRKIPGAFPD